MSFLQGFESGSRFAGDVINDQRNRQMDQLRMAQDARAAEMHGLQVGGLQRQAKREGEIDAARGEVLGLMNQAPVSGEAPEAGFGRRRGLANATARYALMRDDMTGYSAARGEGLQVDRDAALAGAYSKFDAMNDDEIAKNVDNATRGAHVPGFGTWVRGKNGYLSYQPSGGEPVKLSRQEVRDLFAANELARVDPTAAREMLAKTTEKARLVAKDLFTAQTQAAGVDNAGTHYARQDSRDQARLRITQDQADQAKYQILNPQISYRLGPDGRAVPVMTGLRLSQRGGGYETFEQPMPGGSGLIPGDVMNPQKYARQAEAMVGQPTGRQDQLGGKELFTYETALDTLMRQGTAAYGAQGRGPAGVDPSRVQRSIEEANKAAPAPRGNSTVTESRRLQELRDLGRPGPIAERERNAQIMQELMQRRRTETLANEGNLDRGY